MALRGRHQKLKSGDEWDAIYHKLACLCVFNNNSGLRKRIKKILNKRQRKEAKNFKCELQFELIQ